MYIPLVKFHKTDSVKPPQCFYNFPPSAFAVLQFCKLCGGNNTLYSEVPEFCDDTSLRNGHSHFYWQKEIKNCDFVKCIVQRLWIFPLMVVDFLKISSLY